MKFLVKILILTAFISYSFKAYSQLTLDSIVTTDVIDCYGDATGTISVYVTGDNPPFQYSIDSGVTYQAGNVFNGLTAGLYSVYVIDIFNVVVSDIVYIDEPDEIHIISEIANDVTGCFGDANGTITITATGGTGVGTYDFSIDNGTSYFNNGGNFSLLPAGTYDIWVRDANLCEKAGSAITVGQPPELLIATETVVDIIGCPGSANGSIDIGVTGGTALFEYSIDNGSTYQPGHYFPLLTPGDYYSRVRDSEGCVTIGDSVLTITEPPVVVIDSIKHTHVTGCNGGHNGTITIFASGGSGILTYSIDGAMTPMLNNGGIFTDLFAGTYTPVVIDANGCGVDESDIIITQPDELNIISESQTEVTGCFGDETGTITINASGGSGVFEYAVNPGMVWQGANTIINLPAGTYSTRIRDANDITCYVDGSSHIITQPASLLVTEVSTTNVSTCTGGNDGSIHITTNGGGTQPYQFSIDGGITYPHSFDIEDLSAGIYNIIVQDAHFCTDTFTTHIVEIDEPDPIIISSEVPTDPICFGEPTGSIDVTASGGTGSLLFSPNGGTNFYTGNILSGLSAGIPFTIVVEDANGCSTTGSTIILGEPDELIIDSIVSEPVNDCFGGSNGSIVIYAIGGTAPINYSIDSEITYQLSNTFNGLSESSNHVMIKDLNNCKTDGGVIVITEPEPLLISNQSYIDVLGCHGENLGEIHIEATGGTPHITTGYQFSINGSPFAYNNGDYINLAAGDYDIVINDENSCTAVVNTITINEPDVLVTDTLSANKELFCFGDATGFISMTASGGTPPYQYSTDNGVSYQTSSFFNNLPAGTYQSYAKDAYDCDITGPEVIITEPSLLEISSVVSQNINDCYGDDDGTITIAASGGTPTPPGPFGYMYTIDMGSSWYANGGAFTNLSPGDYFVKIRDANYCETSYLDTITFTEPDLIEITSLSKVDFDCFGDDDGEIHISAIGGTGVLTYFITSGTYSPPGQPNGDFTSLPAEDYTVHVEDANACSSKNEPISVYEPPELVITNVEWEDESCPGANDGSITIIAGGGEWPYDYSVDDITYQHNLRTIENLAPGDYTAYIFDSNSCDTTWGTTVTIEEASFTSDITADVTEGCSPLTVNFHRLNAGTTYSWDFGDGTPSSSDSTHTFYNNGSTNVIYTVNAYSESPAPNYCKDTVEIEITVYPQAQVSFTAEPQDLIFPDATVTFENVSPLLINYFWDFGDGTTSTDESPGTHTYDDCGVYFISLSAETNDSYNCPGTHIDTITITANQPQAFFEVDTTQHCTPFTFNFENQSTFTESFEWVLDDGSIITDNDFSYFSETPGNYNITLNAFGYCDTYDSYDTTITIFQSPIVNFDVFPDTVMLPDQPIHCVNNSSDDGELFFWEFGDGGTSTEENPLYQYTTEGSFPIQLTVVTVNKCIDSLTYLTEVIVLPEGDALFPNAFTPNGDGINDQFKPALYYSVESFSMRIYNRWGELVFYTDDINNGWTGYSEGRLSLQDVYVWRAEGIYINGTPFIFSGSVTLLR